MSHPLVHRFSLIAALVVLVSTAAASPQVVEVPRASLSTKVKAAPTNLTCDLCEFVVDIAVDIIKNKTVDGDVAALVDDVCAAILKNKTTVDIDLCKIIVNATLLDLAPLLVKGIDSLAWNVPQTVCADLFKLCLEPCCNEGTPFQPEQVHLSFNSSASLSEIRVTWVTLNDTTTSTVTWKLAASQRDPSCSTAQGGTAAGVTRTYTVGGWWGVIHSAVMSSLKPGCAYEYQVGDAVAWSNWYTYAALPANIGTTARPLNVLAIADLGYGPKGQATVAAMNKRALAGEVDVILHYGDISYADGDEHHWDIFFREIEPAASRVPYMTTPGNHELWWNFTAYRARLWMPPASDQSPGAEDPDHVGRMYYRFNVGSAAFLMLDSETWIDTADIGPRQQAWLKQELLQETSGAVTYPWGVTSPPVFLVAVHHRPLYCTGDKMQCTTFADLLREQVEPIYDAAGIDFGVSGHMHCWTRTYPVSYGGQLTGTSYADPTSPFYILNGAAGNREGNSEPPMDRPWVADVSADYGYAMFQFAADDGMMMSNMGRPVPQVVKSMLREAAGSVRDVCNITFYRSADDAVIDSAQLVKTKRRPTPPPPTSPTSSTTSSPTTSPEPSPAPTSAPTPTGAIVGGVVGGVVVVSFIAAAVYFKLKRAAAASAAAAVTAGPAAVGTTEQTPLVN